MKDMYFSVECILQILCYLKKIVYWEIGIYFIHLKLDTYLYFYVLKFSCDFIMLELKSSLKFIWYLNENYVRVILSLKNNYNLSETFLPLLCLCTYEHFDCHLFIASSDTNCVCYVFFVFECFIIKIYLKCWIQ